MALLKKNIISLNSIVLFIFVIFFILFSNEQDLVVNFIVFIFLFAYLIIDVFQYVKDNFFYYCKIAIILVMILFLVIAPQFLSISLRHNTQPHLYVHDNPIQIEGAINFLVQGKNPYAEEYFSTPLNDWPYYIENDPSDINPGLYHLIALPTHLLISLPVYGLSKFFIGWYDQRFVYFLAFLISLYFLYKLIPKRSNKLLALTLFGLHPLTAIYFIEGRNDILVLSFLILTFYFLQRNKMKSSAIFLALACTTKHSAWFILPFYFLYLYYRNQGAAFWPKIKNLWQQTYPFFLLVIIIICPFLFWNASAFIDDVYNHAAGTLPTSYPIAGYGFSKIIELTSWVVTVRDYFPFWIFQLAFGLPILLLLAKRQKRFNTLSSVWIGYLLLTFVFWYFSRFFNNNYIGFLSQLIIIAYFVGPEVKRPLKVVSSPEEAQKLKR